MTPEASRLHQWVAGEGEPLASKLGIGESGPGFGELLAAGPLTSGNADEYGLVLEAIREGYLCHYGEPWLIRDADRDLLLLAGDLFYAFGIKRLAGLEDLQSVGILSDLIRVAADLHAQGRAELAERLWVVQLMALACGFGPGHKRLLERLESGDIEALEGLEQWSRKMAVEKEMDRALKATREAIDSRFFQP